MERRRSFVERLLAVSIMAALAIAGTAAVGSAKSSKLTAAQAEAKAQGVLLTPADLGTGWVVDTTDFGSLPAETATAVASCSGVSGFLPGGTQRGLGQAHGQLNTGQDVPVVLDVAVFASSADARRYMKSARSRKLRDCARDALELGTNDFLKSLGASVTVSDRAPEAKMHVKDQLVADGYEFVYGGVFAGGADAVFRYELQRGRVVATVQMPGRVALGEQERLLKVLSKRMASV